MARVRYVVMGLLSDYEDSERWPVAAYDDPIEALRHRALAEQQNDRIRGGEERVGRKGFNPFDPKAVSVGAGTRYRVIPVEMRDCAPAPIVNNNLEGDVQRVPDVQFGEGRICLVRWDYGDYEDRTEDIACAYESGSEARRHAKVADACMAALEEALRREREQSDELLRRFMNGPGEYVRPGEESDVLQAIRRTVDYGEAPPRFGVSECPVRECAPEGVVKRGWSVGEVPMWVVRKSYGGARPGDQLNFVLEAARRAKGPGSEAAAVLRPLSQHGQASQNRDTKESDRRRRLMGDVREIYPVLMALRQIRDRLDRAERHVAARPRSADVTRRAMDMRELLGDNIETLVLNPVLDLVLDVRAMERMLCEMQCHEPALREIVRDEYLNCFDALDAFFGKQVGRDSGASFAGLSAPTPLLTMLSEGSEEETRKRRQAIGEKLDKDMDGLWLRWRVAELRDAPSALERLRERAVTRDRQPTAP